MISKLLISIFLSFSVFNLAHAADMQNVNLKWKNYGLDKYRILVHKVENGEHVEVLDQVVTSNRYIFTNDQSGFFFLRVYALPSNKLLASKPLYWSSTDQVYDDGEKMICEKKLKFAWKKNSIDSKYLFRLVEKQTGRVVYSRVTRDDSVSVNSEDLVLGNNYHAFVVSYDEAGHVEVLLDSEFRAVSCREIPPEPTPYLDRAQMGIAYLPSFGSFKDELVNTVDYNVASYLNGRFYYLSPTMTKYQVKFGGDISYNLYDSPFNFTHVDFDGTLIAEKQLRNNWLASARLKVINLSALKVANYLKDGSEVEERLVVYGIGAGITYRDYFFKKKIDCFLNMQTFPVGATGYQIMGGAKVYFNSHWWWVVEGETLNVTDDYDVSRVLIRTGPVYNF